MIIDTYINNHKEKINVTSWAETKAIAFTFTEQNEADKFEALFPKYCKAKNTMINSWEDGRSVNRPHVSFGFWSSTNKVTGEVNETSEKRKNKINEILKENNYL